jgi:hypothetical protein
MLLPSGSDSINKTRLKPNTMNAFKTFTCTVAAAAALAFCAPSTRAVTPITTTTNDIILSLSLTLITNGGGFFISETNFSNTVGKEKLTTKDLLQLLGGGNGFSTNTFSSGDQVAIAYDFPWNGHVVVVDKTGTNVLFDATKNNNNTNATLAINLFAGDAFTESDKVEFKAGGSMTFVTYAGGTFTLFDKTNSININITGSGPSPVKFTQKLNSGTQFSTNQFASWTDSADFNFFGATDELWNQGATINGTLTGKGSGKGLNGFMYNFFF